MVSMSPLRSRSFREMTCRFPLAPILLALAFQPALFTTAFGQSRMVQVPGVVDTSAAEARKLLTAKALLIDEQKLETSAVKPGVVARQDPAAGSWVQPKSTVRIWVAVAPLRPGGKNLQDAQGLTAIAGFALVPNLVGKRIDDVPGILAAARLAMGDRQQVPSIRTPGTVLTQSHAASSRVPVGTQIGVSFAVAMPAGAASTSRPPRPLYAPDIRGLSLREAASILKSAGLHLGMSTEVHTGAREGTIVSQTPDPNTPVKPGTGIDVRFEGRTRAVVPDLTGRTLREASSLLSDEGLRLGDQTTVKTGAREGTVVRQEPGANTRVASGTRVTVWYEEPRRPVVVPDLIGRTLRESEDLLSSVGLRLGKQGTVKTGAPPDTVVDQSPKPNEHVASGSSVSVRVEASAPPLVVPEIRGRSLQEAIDILASARLRMGGQRKVSTGAAEGTVVDQRPPPGSQVTPGTLVDVAIEALRQPVAVPDLNGRSLVEAIDLLSAAGLALGSHQEVQNEQRSQGTVVSQSPEAGALVDPGTAVAVQTVAATVPVMPAVPDVRRLTLSDAAQRLAAGGFTPGRIEEAVEAGEAGTVARQNPGAGSLAAVGSAVDLVLVAGPLRVTLSSSVTRSAPGEPVTLSASMEGRASDVEYEFDFGDGERLGWARASSVQHRYAHGGSFQPTVRVRDALQRIAGSEPLLLEVVPAGNGLLWALVTGGFILGAFAAARVARLFRSHPKPGAGAGPIVTIHPSQDPGSQFMDDGVPALLHEIRFVPEKDMGEQSLDNPEQLVPKGE